MKKIIVTGGAGFIGSHTVVELIGAGYEPIIIDDFSNSDERVLAGLKKLLGREPILYRTDCTDKNAILEIFKKEKPEAVIHFAAYKAVNESVENPLKYYRNNLLSLIVILEVMQAVGMTKLVFSSSCTVYGQPDENPVMETSPLKEAASPYGYTKQICEQIIRDQHKAFPKLSSAMLRYFNPVGAHPSGHIGELPFGVPNNLMPYITQTAIGIRHQLVVFGDDYNTMDGTCIRDFIHVVDLAKAHVSAIQWLDNNEGRCDIFNIGQGRGDSVMDAIKTFVRVTGEQLNYVVGPRRPGDVEQVWADTVKAEKELNWKTELTLEDAVKDAWLWEQNLQKTTKS
jgi:UDP-glucose 4-epimerase